MAELASYLSGDLTRPGDRLAAEERRRQVRGTAAGAGTCLLSVPGIRCGGCVAAIERALAGRSDVVAARANLTLRRVGVTLPTADTDPQPIIEALAALGYPAELIDRPGGGPELAAAPGLLRAVAVAGFGAMNVMVLSVAVWSGAAGATRETLHLVSALIAVPVVLYSGQTFFRSALAALRRGRLNMDVPIALAVIVTLALSLFETARGGPRAFFDAAVTLLFFLLVGRYLDQLMRQRARSAVEGLRRLVPQGALVRRGEALEYLPLDVIEPGMVVHVGAGERVPVDARIERGTTDLDRSLVTGEALPVAAGPGDPIEAGTLNLTGEVEAVALKGARDSFLAEMSRMLAAAEAGRGTYVRIADRAARLYAPVVHLVALATFVGWLLATGDWRLSIFVAVSVLIITCPCALGLAVPVAHVVAAGRLMREGILLRDGTGLERLAEIDRVVFDKTGTLTSGTPELAAAPAEAPLREGARALALHSRHPAARAIAAVPCRALEATDVAVLPGYGVEGVVDGRRARLGRASWVAEIAAAPAAGPGPAFAVAGGPVGLFAITERLRPGAQAAVAGFRAAGLPVSLLSGDTEERVDRIAAELGIAEVRSGATPADKIACLEALRREGHRALMVGDGLNDTAALAAAHVSMAPASAADAGRAAADFVFLREDLEAVTLAHGLARATAGIVRQNFGFAIVYNCVAIPLAIAGFVTPLIAALAMSASSILVIANALRLNLAPGARARRAVGRPEPATAVPA